MLAYSFTHAHERSREECSALLGGKGAGLARMAGELGLPVPPGFTITTEACRAYRAGGWNGELEAALRKGVSEIESVTGLGFGSAEAPLLLSVRSGAAISMPGMMDTLLDLGWTPSTRAGLERYGSEFALDTRRRFEESYRATVGGPPSEDPWDQLFRAVEAVFRSVDSPRARAYRAREGLPTEMLTAVNVQAMVFGNRDAQSATGVVFSRDPATGEPQAYGDVLFRAQGEDVVSGAQQTEPIAVLDERLPEVARRLMADLALLERTLGDLCEVEFTIEEGRLWLLQVRVGKRSPRAALRIAHDLAEDPDFPLDRHQAVLRVRQWLADPPSSVASSEAVASGAGAEPDSLLGTGLGASPGIASGEVVLDAVEAVRRAEQGRAVILVRPETSPSDVEGMSRATGLLTARGGLASHAAVVARGWGIPAVVGLEALELEASGFRLGGQRIGLGDTISLDGTTGRVYAGTIVSREEPVPEAAILQRWAQELGVEIGGDPSALPVAGKEAGRPVPLERDDVRGAAEEADRFSEADALLYVLSIRGSATTEALVEAFACASLAASAVTGLIEALEAEALIEAARMLGWTLSEAGQRRAAELVEADRQAVGQAVVRSTIEAFQPLDARLKQAVTDWQLRRVAGELAPNDHTDADWDLRVFDRLDQLNTDLALWLEPLRLALPRFDRYRARFERALDAAQGGDGRYVASPRVDSMHGVWFELHEDLIRLAGSTRAQEVAAGRTG